MASLTPNQITELRAALLQAFNRDEFTELVLVALNEQLINIIPSGALATEVFHLIQWSERQGTTVMLVAKSLELRPNNGALKAVAAPIKAQLITETSSVIAPDQSQADFHLQLQHILRPELPLADVAVWADLLDKAQRAVCRVELTQGTGEGTGFLVAKNMVLTSYHVIKTLVDAPAEDAAEAVLRFDYKRNPEAKPIQDREYRLTPDWLAASSPCNQLDYALLRVKADPGSEEMGTPERPRARGWLKLSSAAPAAGHPLQILQHPKTLPMKLTFGTTLADSPPNVLMYNVNTADGSSGSPVANGSWKIVALHRCGGPNHNRGVASSAILQDLEANHHATLLG